MSVNYRAGAPNHSSMELILRKLKYVTNNHLNGYSWSIMAAFIGANIAMNYHVHQNALKDFFLTLPIVVLMVYWSQKSYSLKRSATPLTKKAIFNRDLFLITFSFTLGCLLSLLFEFNNSDATGWWTFILYFFVVYGFIFALAFSAIALLLPHPNGYSITFALIIILFIAAAKFLPRYIPIPIIGTIEMFYVVTGLLIVGHAIIFCGGSLIKRDAKAV